MNRSISKIVRTVHQIGIYIYFFLPFGPLVDKQYLPIFFCHIPHTRHGPGRSRNICPPISCPRRWASENNQCIRIYFPDFRRYLLKLCLVSIINRIVCSEHNRYDIRAILCHTLLNMLQRPRSSCARHRRVYYDVVYSPQIFFYIFFKKLCNTVMTARMLRGMGNRISHKKPRQRSCFIICFRPDCLLQLRAFRLRRSCLIPFLNLSCHRNKLNRSVLRPDCQGIFFSLRKLTDRKWISES